jgi:peptidoglycan hydrolase-like protein with peptidoglycan-binding domain
MYQKALLLLGYSPLVVDGLYKMKNPKSESETKKMIRKFQKTMELKDDGIPGPDTATKIYEALQKLQKPNG